MKKSVQLTQTGSSTPEKRNISYSSNSILLDVFQPSRTSSFETLQHFIAYWKIVYINAREIRYAVAWLLRKFSNSFATFDHLQLAVDDLHQFLSSY